MPASPPRGLLDPAGVPSRGPARPAGTSLLEGASAQDRLYGEEGGDRLKEGSRNDALLPSPKADTTDVPVTEWGLGPISGYGVFRGKDAYGNGAFGEPRKKSETGQIKSYKHTGVDVGLYNQTMIYAPVTGVMRRSKPYANDPLEGVEIQTPEGRKVQILYIDPLSDLFAELSKGNTVNVEAGQPIGRTHTLQHRFPPRPGVGKMTDHVHVRLIDRYGRVADPTPWLQEYLGVPEHLGRAWQR
ncbi:MAG: hypothetical protein ACOY3L_15445 [Pseudomonadota bacterium]